MTCVYTYTRVMHLLRETFVTNIELSLFSYFTICLYKNLNFPFKDCDAFNSIICIILFSRQYLCRLHIVEYLFSKFIVDVM